MICLVVGLSFFFGICFALGLSHAWLNRNAPREDHDFLRACDWREEAEAEVERLRKESGK